MYSKLHGEEEKSHCLEGDINYIINKYKFLRGILFL